MNQTVEIKVGESGASFAHRYAGIVRIVHQPAGLDFYKIDLDRQPRGTVKLDHGAHSVAIDDVLGVSTSEDQAELKSEGLFEFTVYSGMSVPRPGLISHDGARINIQRILRGILKAGWRQVIERSEPRLSGKTRMEYTFATSNLNGLDASYAPTLEEWMRIESDTPWSFYADGLYMDVSFAREPTLTDPAKPGAYLLTFAIKTETEYFRGYADPDNRLRWKELLPQELIKVAALRARKEAELRAAGVQIDEAYQDPPVPSLR